MCDSSRNGGSCEEPEVFVVHVTNQTGEENYFLPFFPEKVFFGFLLPGLLTMFPYIFIKFHIYVFQTNSKFWLNPRFLFQEREYAMGHREGIQLDLPRVPRSFNFLRHLPRHLPGGSRRKRLRHLRNLQEKTQTRSENLHHLFEPLRHLHGHRLCHQQFGDFLAPSGQLGEYFFLE